MRHAIMLLLCVVFLNACGGDKKEPQKTENKSAEQTVDDTKFYGLLTIDSYDVAGCEITAVGDSIVMTRYMKSAQMHEFNNEDNYLQQLSNTVITDLRESMRDAAIESSYNAVLGYTVIPMTHFEGFGGSVVNGAEGVGYAVLVAQGTPVTIKCEKTSK